MPQAIDLSLASPMMSPRLPCISPVDIQSSPPTLIVKMTCRRVVRLHQGRGRSMARGKGIRMDRTGIFAGDDPFAIAKAWLAEAEAQEINDPNAIALATVDADGLPNVRMVLLKDIEDAALSFTPTTAARRGKRSPPAARRPS